MERQELIKWLNSYRVAVARIHDLRKRRAQLSESLAHTPGFNYDGMPKGTTVTDGMDSVVKKLDRLAEIEAELAQQEIVARDYVAEILTALNKLPEGSEGRRALELRHIDGLTILDACDKMNVSERTYWRLYNNAIDELLKAMEGTNGH